MMQSSKYNLLSVLGILFGFCIYATRQIHLAVIWHIFAEYGLNLRLEISKPWVSGDGQVGEKLKLQNAMSKNRSSDLCITSLVP